MSPERKPTRIAEIESEISAAKRLKKRNPMLFWFLCSIAILAASSYIGYQLIYVRRVNIENQRLTTELESVRQERDAAQSRLAPYEAIARRFPGDTDEERQKLVVSNLAQIGECPLNS